MALWYANSGSPRYADKGKFQQRAKTGLSQLAEVNYRDWFYQFTSHQTGTSVRRTTYSVAIADPNGHRAEYLRGFSNLDQAGNAARDWIDEIIVKINKRLQITPLGNIPKYPNAAANQENTIQEKSN
jgi:hypothetical protein